MAEGRAPHIVLVGLMGSGKTTVGRRVASALGRPFFDADEVLVAGTGRTIAQWFAEDGEAVFRRREVEVLEELLSRPEPAVVATGGGVVVSEENRRRLAADDVTVVWLHGSPAFLASRVKRKEHRPLLEDDPAVTLERLFAERSDWYRQVADLTIDVQPALEGGGKPKMRLAAEVVEALVAHVPGGHRAAPDVSEAAGSATP